MTVTVTTGVGRVVLQSQERMTDDTMGLLFVALFFAVGLYVVYKGFDDYRLSRLIANTPTEKVQSMAVGRTELEGAATVKDEVFDQPFSDGKCLYAKYDIQERRKKKNHDPDDHGDEYKWVTIDSGEYAAPFLLDDGTGAVEVEAGTDARFTISNDHKKTLRDGRGSGPPSGVQKFLDGQRDGPWSPSANPKQRRKHKYRQTVLPPETDTYVFGDAEPRDIEDVDAGAENEDRLVVNRDDETERFIISDMGEDVLATKFRRRGPALILLGLLISAGCLYVLANDLQVMF